MTSYMIYKGVRYSGYVSGACPTPAYIDFLKYFVTSAKKYSAFIKRREMFLSGHSPTLSLQNVSKQYSMRFILIELR